MTKTIIICKNRMEDSKNTLSSMVTYFKSWFGSMVYVTETLYVTKISYKDNVVHIFTVNCTYASLRGRRCDYYITDDDHPRDYFRLTIGNPEELSVESAKSKIKEILFSRSYKDTDSFDYSSIYPTNPWVELNTMKNELNSFYGMKVNTKQMEKTKKVFKNMFNIETDIRLSIKRVIFNKPATIVFWTDGTKTVVKCGENDIYDPEKGLAMAISKKVLGNKGNFNEVFKKWLPEKE